ncbi:hypothetical protein DH2020_037140 [Rehmannia glutinosa]|uniref:Uncharacterized protein n=1 Tax=Rehmannia glutinosa TaxID=99300 RepID=A0ABR0V3U1_REHGL
MAEVTNLHRQHQPPSSRRPVSTTMVPHQEPPVQQEEEFYHQPSPFVFEFDPFPLPITLQIPLSSMITRREEDDEQLNFVTDLFEPRHSHVTEDLIWDLDSGQADESAFEFGFGPGLGSSMGLRVVGMDSESDSAELEVNSGFINDDDDNYDSFGVSNDNFHTSENEREEFEWEVSERTQFDERDNLNLLINGIEEITVSSEISSSEDENSNLGDDEGTEEARNIEWEVLLAVNNLESTFDFEYSEEIDNPRSEVSRINLPEDYILTMEYDALFGQLVENENALKGSPPAAKSVVENLPSVVLTKEEIGENNNVVCAVCHELPTDDADYEKRKNERVGSGITTTPRLVDDFEDISTIRLNIIVSVELEARVVVVFQVVL